MFRRVLFVIVFLAFLTVSFTAALVAATLSVLFVTFIKSLDGPVAAPVAAPVKKRKQSKSTVSDRFDDHRKRRNRGYYDMVIDDLDKPYGMA